MGGLEKRISLRPRVADRAARGRALAGAALWIRRWAVLSDFGVKIAKCRTMPDRFERLILAPRYFRTAVYLRRCRK